jgi:hypothetical protein
VQHSVEKDILQVVVSEEEAPALFDFLHEKAAIGERHGGFMFQGSVAAASAFSLPEGLSPR